SGRSASAPAHGARDALAARGGPQARREVDGTASRGGIDGGRGRPRRRGEEARGSAPDGRSQQGLFAFQVLTKPKPTKNTEKRFQRAMANRFPLLEQQKHNAPNYAHRK